MISKFLATRRLQSAIAIEALENRQMMSVAPLVHASVFSTPVIAPLYVTPKPPVRFAPPTPVVVPPPSVTFTEYFNFDQQTGALYIGASLVIGNGTGTVSVQFGQTRAGEVVQVTENGVVTRFNAGQLTYFTVQTGIGNEVLNLTENGPLSTPTNLNVFTLGGNTTVNVASDVNMGISGNAGILIVNALDSFDTGTCYVYANGANTTFNAKNMLGANVFYAGYQGVDVFNGGGNYNECHAGLAKCTFNGGGYNVYYTLPSYAGKIGADTFNGSMFGSNIVYYSSPTDLLPVTTGVAKGVVYYFYLNDGDGKG